MKCFVVQHSIFIVMLLLCCCKNPNREREKAKLDSTPKLSIIEFHFQADNQLAAESLKQAFVSDSLYQLDTIYKVEESLWLVSVKTRDSMMVSPETEDATIELLSKRLKIIAERYHCDLVGFAHE
jgi:hypothetical protein